MSRIAPRPRSLRRPFVAMSLAITKRRVGQAPDSMRILARHPQIFQGHVGLEFGLDRAHKVDKRLKELVSLKSAALAGCEFCIDIASALAQTHGVTEAQIRALPTYATSPEFDDVERLVLDLAVGMSVTPVDVSDELIDRVLSIFSEEQLIELCATIAIEQYRARLNWALGIGAQGFADGMVCAVPEPQPGPAHASV